MKARFKARRQNMLDQPWDRSSIFSIPYREKLPAPRPYLTSTPFLPPLYEMMDWITYGATQIDFRLICADRKTMAIDVHPDSSVVVLSTKGSDSILIRETLKRTASCIVTQPDLRLAVQPLTWCLCTYHVLPYGENARLSCTSIYH